MIKKRGFLVITLFVMIFSGINVFLFINKSGNFSYSTISGRILEDLPGIGAKMNLSIIAFIVQWIILLAILFFAYSKFLKHKQQENISIDYNVIKRKKGRAETDLDTLYNLLKDKKNLSIETISKLFNIKKAKALEWGKILENHELVRIEYPAFSPPEVILDEKENEKEKKDKNKEKGKEDQKQTKEKEQKENKGKATSKNQGNQKVGKEKEASHNQGNQKVGRKQRRN